MSQADKYEPGSKPTKTSGHRGTGDSATGSNPGPNLRPAPEKDDAIMGTTSGVPPKTQHKPGYHREGKPEHGSRFDADS